MGGGVVGWGGAGAGVRVGGWGGWGGHCHFLYFQVEVVRELVST